ncbi:MAG: M17 family peptidase N-terminal domain-containing protein [Bdellovibrionota bacterium]
MQAAPFAETDKALFSGTIQGLIVTCYENERPPCGLAGLVDWRFQGAISRYLMSGTVTGKAGECTYLPITRHGLTYHLLLVGGGSAASPGSRAPVAAETIKALQKNLLTMRLPKLGLSRADFGGITSELLNKALKGAPLWIAP